MKFKIQFASILLSIFLHIFISSQCFSKNSSGTIVGTIKDQNNKILTNVNTIILGTSLGAASDNNGMYRIENIKPGEYALKFMYIGYRPEIKNKIIVNAKRETRLDINLIEDIIQFQAITVTPGSYTLSQRQTSKMQAIRKERINSMPASMDDINRILQIMPGVAFAHDGTAHLQVRGGKQDENLMLVDGIEVFDPYHLKNVGGATGIMNMDIIDNVSILTGGFPAKYGDKLSSVVSIQNRTANPEKFSGIIGLGGTGTKIVLEGPIPRGSWLVSYRKSFIKEAVELLNPSDKSFSPSFYDTQMKISLTPNNNHKITANLLYSHDKSRLEQWPEESGLTSSYNNMYYGLVWKTLLSNRLLSEFTFSHGNNYRNNQAGIGKKLSRYHSPEYLLHRRTEKNPTPI